MVPELPTESSPAPPSIPTAPAADVVPDSLRRSVLTATPSPTTATPTVVTSDVDVTLVVPVFTIRSSAAPPPIPVPVASADAPAAAPPPPTSATAISCGVTAAVEFTVTGPRFTMLSLPPPPVIPAADAPARDVVLRSRMSVVDASPAPVTEMFQISVVASAAAVTPATFSTRSSPSPPAIPTAPAVDVDEASATPMPSRVTLVPSAYAVAVAVAATDARFTMRSLPSPPSIPAAVAAALLLVLSVDENAPPTAVNVAFLDSALAVAPAAITLSFSTKSFPLPPAIPHDRAVAVAELSAIPPPRRTAEIHRLFAADVAVDAIAPRFRIVSS